MQEGSPPPAARQRPGCLKGFLALPSLPLPHPGLPLLSCSPVKFGPCLLRGGDRPTGCHSNFRSPRAPCPLPVGCWGVKLCHGHVFCPRRCLGGSSPCPTAVRGECCTLAVLTELLHGSGRMGFFGKGAAGPHITRGRQCEQRLGGSRESLCSLLSVQMLRWW